MRLLVASLIVAGAAHAQPLGTAVPVSGTGCRFPDVAWSATSSRFLAVWADYSISPARVCGRLVTSEGMPLSNLTCYSDVAANALYPAVAWNAATDEFLITWDDSGRPAGGEGIWAQRVNAADGAARGANLAISSNGIRSGVTSLGSAGFAVIYAANLEALVTFVSTTGVIGAQRNVSEDAIFSGYPAITAVGDRVLASWDRDDGAIAARVLSASTQAVLGGPFAASPIGARDRSSSAVDEALGVFWVNFNDQSVGGQSYNQQAQRLSLDGGLIGGPINVAATAAFEGETLVGTDIAFDTFAGRALTAFQSENSGSGDGLAVQELSESGALEGTSGLISVGADGVMAIAVDQRAHHAVVVWERQNAGAPHAIYLRAVKLRDTRPPGPPGLGTWVELSDGGVALPIASPPELDAISVSLFAERDGGLVLAGTSSIFPAEVSFERRSQRLCATVFDGTNDSAPSCVEVTLPVVPVVDGGQPERDAGITNLDAGTSPDGGAMGPGQIVGTGSCGCGLAPDVVMLFSLVLLRRRSLQRRKSEG